MTNILKEDNIPIGAKFQLSFFKKLLLIFMHHYNLILLIEFAAFVVKADNFGQTDA